MQVLSNRATYAAICAVVTLVAVGSASSAAASELDDIVARIDYGFYTAEPRVIEAAREALERAGAAGGAHAYYAAYAAYRLSWLDRTVRPRERRALIRSCVESARTSARTEAWAVEAWILVAACSVHGIAEEPSRARSHETRLAEALTAARELDADNPRLLLVESSYRPDATAQESEGRRELLERARAEFDARGYEDGPDWGRAEVLASLGKLYLERGQRREARDVIEQALIEAPDYYFALELRKAVSSQR